MARQYVEWDTQVRGGLRVFCIAVVEDSRDPGSNERLFTVDEIEVRWQGSRRPFSKANRDAITASDWARLQSEAIERAT